MNSFGRQQTYDYLLEPRMPFSSCVPRLTTGHPILTTSTSPEYNINTFSGRHMLQYRYNIYFAPVQVQHLFC